MDLIVVPGDVIGSTDDFECGYGCYVHQSSIRASVAGVKVVLDTSGKKSTICVKSPKGRIAEEGVVNVGDVVVCQVQRLAVGQVAVSIILVGEQEIEDGCKGIIRKEDITSRSIEIDTISLFECFRPGDIIRAQVMSLGDARQYYLTTDGPSLGVIAALSQDGNIMVAANAKVNFH
jgi:exosome complex component CSL4